MDAVLARLGIGGRTPRRRLHHSPSDHPTKSRFSLRNACLMVEGSCGPKSRCLDGDAADDRHRLLLQRGAPPLPRGLPPFVAEEIAPHHARWEKEGKVDREAWRKAGEAGMLLTNIPRRIWRRRRDFLTSAIFIEEMMGHVFTGPGFRLHSDIVAPYILNNASEDLKRHWLPKMASGEAIGALAMTEPGAGSDVQAIRTTAIRDGNHWVINGQKTFITNGQLADIIVVACKTDPKAGAKGVSLILVEADREGFKRGRNLEKIGLKAQDTSELFFDNVRVPPPTSSARRAAASPT